MFPIDRNISGGGYKNKFTSSLTFLLTLLFSDFYSWHLFSTPSFYSSVSRQSLAVRSLDIIIMSAMYFFHPTFGLPLTWYPFKYFSWQLFLLQPINTPKPDQLPSLLVIQFIPIHIYTLSFNTVSHSIRSKLFCTPPKKFFSTPPKKFFSVGINLFLSLFIQSQIFTQYNIALCTNALYIVFLYFFFPFHSKKTEFNARIILLPLLILFST